MSLKSGQSHLKEVVPYESFQVPYIELKSLVFWINKVMAYHQREMWLKVRFIVGL